jgi:rhodanese-related sulfurtransferase
MSSSKRSGHYNGAVQRLLILLAVALSLGAGANAVSPRGLSWTRPLGRGVGAQVADAGLTIVDLASMRQVVQSGSARLLDARSPEDFAIGRLPGATWWKPEGPLPPRDRPIVVYCANEFCEASLRLGEQLQKLGYPGVAVFVDGYEAWWNAGGTVDQD